MVIKKGSSKQSKKEYEHLLLFHHSKDLSCAFSSSKVSQYCGEFLQFSEYRVFGCRWPYLVHFFFIDGFGHIASALQTTRTITLVVDIGKSQRG